MTHSPEYLAGRAEALEEAMALAAGIIAEAEKWANATSTAAAFNNGICAGAEEYREAIRALKETPR
jgi:hypothetical protein